MVMRRLNVIPKHNIIFGIEGPLIWRSCKLEAIESTRVELMMASQPKHSVDMCLLCKSRLCFEPRANDDIESASETVPLVMRPLGYFAAY